MTAATATVEPLTAADLEAEISATEKTIDKLTAEQHRLSLATLRHEPGAAEAVVKCEKALDAARHAWRLASDAVIALGAEEAAAEKLAQAEQAAQLESDWTAKREALDEALIDFQHLLDDLVVGVRVALAAGAELYNIAVARGIHGNPLNTRNGIESRIGHVLNLEAGLTQFDLARGTGRDPLVGDATPRHIVPQATPLPDRRDSRDVAHAYTGQNLASRPIIKTELRNAAGDWVEVPIGSVDWPDERVTTVAPQVDADGTATDERLAKHQADDAAARKAKKAAARILVPGEEQ